MRRMKLISKANFTYAEEWRRFAGKQNVDMIIRENQWKGTYRSDFTDSVVITTSTYNNFQTHPLPSNPTLTSLS